MKKLKVTRIKVYLFFNNRNHFENNIKIWVNLVRGEWLDPSYVSMWCYMINNTIKIMLIRQQPHKNVT